jgi:hypothetical protein
MRYNGGTFHPYQFSVSPEANGLVNPMVTSMVVDGHSFSKSKGSAVAGSKKYRNASLSIDLLLYRE